jgi:hypothetical protein
MSFSELLEKYFSTILAGVFTLAGTILGWLLNSISKKGKLKLIKANCEFDQTNESMYGSNLFSYRIDLWIYNSSDNVRPINNISIKTHANRKTYLTSCIENGTKIDHYNFNPKQITKITLVATQDFEEKLLGGEIREIYFQFIYLRNHKQFVIYKSFVYALIEESRVKRFIKRLFVKRKK